MACCRRRIERGEGQRVDEYRILLEGTLPGASHAAIDDDGVIEEDIAPRVQLFGGGRIEQQRYDLCTPTISSS